MSRADAGRKLIEELAEAEADFQGEVNSGWERKKRNEAEERLIAAREAVERWLATL
jgi:hypothetical protein